MSPNSKTENETKPVFWFRQPQKEPLETPPSSYQSLVSLGKRSLSPFSPKSPDIRKQIMSEVECIKRLKQYFNKNAERPIPNDAIFRFASYHGFRYNEAFNDLKGYHTNRRLHLKMNDEMVRQFETKTLIPLPGLKTKRNKSSVIYMKPSRFNPHEMKTSDVIDSLCYVLNHMSRTKEQCLAGVTLIANMEEWCMKNFSNDYCHQFMQALQGKFVPTKVDLFLIVNPPPGFSNIWKLMKPMFSRSFSKKVHVIKESRLNEFLIEGYEKYLPNEFGGWLDKSELLEDLIDLKQYEDGIIQQ